MESTPDGGEMAPGGGECTPISADVALRSLLTGERPSDVCALCSCARSLIKMDDASYVHLNDEYSDRRLTILQLVKESQLSQFVDETTTSVICECCVNSLCTFQLFKIKCHKVNRGLSALSDLVKRDMLQKVVNVTSGLPATVLPYKHVHQYCDGGGEKSSEFPDFGGDIAAAESTSEDEDGTVLIRTSGFEYKCVLCPMLRLKERERESHVLSHYYKNVSRSVVLKRSYCFCCLRDEGIVTEAVGVAERVGDMSFGSILSEVFGYTEAMDLGAVDVCVGCLRRILSLYNFKRMFHASTAVVRGCLLALQLCLAEPRSALTRTDDNKNRNICLLDVYSEFPRPSDRKTQFVPFLRAIRPSMGKVKIVRDVKLRPFRRDRPLAFQKTQTKRTAKNESDALAEDRDGRSIPGELEDRATKTATESTVSCHICAESFYDTSELNLHLKNMHMDMSCLYCGVFCKDSTKLGQHMEMCRDISKPFQCSICSLRFVGKGALMTHRVRHFSKSRFQGSHQTQGIRHDGTARHVCGFCSTSFLFKTDYILHRCFGKIANQHLKLGIDTEADSDEVKSCICDLCGKLFETVRHLQEHQRAHEDSSDEASAEVGRANRERVGLLVSCVECDFTTVYKNCLEAHVNRQHRKVKPYECLSCERRFYSRVNQVQHMKTHVDNGVECEVCGKRFSSRRELVYHAKVHGRVETYQCGVCTRRFVTRLECRVHVREAHDEKKICDRMEILNER